MNLTTMPTRFCRTTLAALLLSSLIGACAYTPPLMRLRIGETEAAVIKLADRKPNEIYVNKDGTRILEFSNQPDEPNTYLVTMDAKGGVTRVEQALTSEQLARVKPGMRRDDVLRLLGKPGRANARAVTGETVWEWTPERSIPSTIRVFHVYFDLTGQVTQTDEKSAPDVFYGDN